MRQTYTTQEAMKVLGISRATFSRWCGRYGFKVVKVGVGRGCQSEWDARRIDEIALYKTQLEKVTA